MFNDCYRGKNVFITGHTGFKGSWLATWLLMMGAKVTGYALPPAYGDSHFELLDLKSRITHIEGDVREYGSLKKALESAKPDFIFHLAAQALVREAYRDPRGTFDTNVGGAVNLLEAVRENETARALVFITSDKCYRNVEWEWGYRETDSLGGADPYSGSKGCAELVFHSYYLSFLKEKAILKASTTRAGNVIGGGDWAKDRIIPDCIRALRKLEPIIVRNPRSTRPWQHVLEPLGGYLHLGYLLYAEPDKVFHYGFNFGPDKNSNKTVKELVERVIKIWGRGEMEVHTPPKAPHEDMLLQLNCDRAWHYLKWKPTWHYDDSLEQTVLWYKAFNEGRNIWDFTSSQIENYQKAFKENLNAWD
ncbi:MAG: CDP-glucose 4,6-dehydratase [Candidatus Eremiobacteraeota bacterium]|nr:CDP-glucose 4,6-dehydratase [Candidatus Eremiobacteraeota bacterium]